MRRQSPGTGPSAIEREASDAGGTGESDSEISEGLETIETLGQGAAEGGSSVRPAEVEDGVEDTEVDGPGDEEYGDGTWASAGTGWGV